MSVTADTCNQVLSQIEEDLRTEIHDLKTGQSGELRIGTVPALIHTAVAPTLATFIDAKGATTAQLRVRVQLSGQLLRGLRRRSPDFALAAVQDDVPPELAMRWSLQMGLFWRRSAYFSSLMKQCRQRFAQAYTKRTDTMPS